MKSRHYLSTAPKLALVLGVCLAGAIQAQGSETVCSLDHSAIQVRLLDEKPDEGLSGKIEILDGEAILLEETPASSGTASWFIANNVTAATLEILEGGTRQEFKMRVLLDGQGAKSTLKEDVILNCQPAF